MKLSKKQAQLLTLITSENEPKIYVEGSVQSGKTYVIALSVILYCQELYKKYPDEKFNAAIIGWTVGTVKRNIVQPMQEFLETMGIKTEVKGGADNPHFDLWNTKVFFFGFQNAISFNRILGSPLIFLLMLLLCCYQRFVWQLIVLSSNPVFFSSVKALLASKFFVDATLSNKS